MAAMLVVSGDRNEAAWGGRRVDLRVDDHDEPLAELRRLLLISRAYRLMNDGDEFMADGDVEQASIAYREASTLMPGNHEPIFWHAVTLASGGREREALPLFAQAFDAWPQWRELVPRLPGVGLLPDDPALLERVLEVR